MPYCKEKFSEGEEVLYLSLHELEYLPDDLVSWSQYGACNGFRKLSKILNFKISEEDEFLVLNRILLTTFLEGLSFIC